MRLKLTEEQLHNLYRRFDLMEQSEVSGTTTSTTGNTQNTGDEGSSQYVKFLNFLKDPITHIANKISGSYNPDSVSGTTSGEGPQYAPNIPPGTELMHPLGPTHKIVSNFGYRNIFGSAQNHKGVDITAAVGTAIYAPADGKVLRAGDTTPNGCGGFIKLSHPGLGLQTKYCHCSKWVVKTGDEVKKGQLIGYTGGAKNAQYAGNSTGPHLHYEVLDSGGIAFNPTKVHSNMA